MGLQYPANCTTPGERLEFACRAKDAMIREHNLMSKWTHHGLTQEEYDRGAEPARREPNVVEELVTLPARVKKAFAYSAATGIGGRKQLPEHLMVQYVKELFRPRLETVHRAIASARKEIEQSFMKSNRWPVDLNAISPIEAM